MNENSDNYSDKNQENFSVEAKISVTDFYVCTVHF